MKDMISLTDRDREIVLAVLHNVPAHSEFDLALLWPDIDDPVMSADSPPASPELVDPAPNSPGALPN